MPGTPRKRAKLLTQLAQQASELASSVFKLAPPRYRTPEPPTDGHGELWHKAVTTMVGADLAIAELVTSLCTKAGVPPPERPPASEELANLQASLQLASSAPDEQSVEPVIQALHAAAAGRKASVAAVWEWVSNQIGTPWERIKPEDVPDASALSLLQEAKKDPKWFWERFMKPAKAMDAPEEDLAADDGDISEADIEALLKAVGG